MGTGSHSPSTSSNCAVSTGLGTYAEAPASAQRRRSSSETFAVKATSGRSLLAGRLAHRLHRLVAIHAGHHDVDEHELHLGRPFEHGDPLGAARRRDDLEVEPLQQRGQREDVTSVVIHDQHRQARQPGALERSGALLAALAGGAERHGVRLRVLRALQVPWAPAAP